MKPRTAYITVAQLREAFILDLETGTIIWRVTPKVWISAGTPAGGLDHQGYWQVNLNGAHLLAHRVVWAMFYGAWPDGPLDHANGVRSDNRITNLRECTWSQNATNRRVGANNTHGTKGITRLPHGKWQAQIKVGGKNKYLGSFVDKDAASKAYNDAAKQAFGEFMCPSVVAA